MTDVCVCMRVCVQNLGQPFVAGDTIAANNIVSLSSTGEVLRGFGLQLSPSVTTFGVVSNPIVLNMTGSIVVVLYNDTNFNGRAVYFDTTQTTPGVRYAALRFVIGAPPIFCPLSSAVL